MRWIETCLIACLLAAAGWSRPAAADSIMECGVVTSNQVELRACLDRQLDISYRAMTEALSMARVQAEKLDQVTGRDAAVLALEGSQHAWEAFRDVNCGLRSTLAAGGSGAGSFQQACAIDMTRARTDELLRLANRK